MKNFKRRAAFTLVEIMTASVIMTFIVLGILDITTQILNTWSRASGQLQSYFDAGVVGAIIQEDLESLKVKKDGRAWLQVAYPTNVGFLTGEDYLDSTPLKPPEIMFYSPTLLRPRYTKEQLISANEGDGKTAKRIPGSVCAIKYQIGLKSPFLESSTNPSDNESQYNAFYGFYRAVIDPKSTALEAMGNVIQGYSKDPAAEDYRYALQGNLWDKTCTVIDENGVEQPGKDLKSWVLAPENLIVMNVVDFRVTFAIFYPNPDSGSSIEEPEYKTGFIAPGVPFVVGRKILTDTAYEFSQGGNIQPMDPRLLEDGFLAYADLSITIISDSGAKEMRAMMKTTSISPEQFKRLVLQHGTTINRRIQFISEPQE